MKKVDRASTDEVYVCGFVPCYALPNKMPWSIDPFLYPLITEIEDLFIDGRHALQLNIKVHLIFVHTGIEVDYKGNIAGLEPGKVLLRCLILCWTGDHPAQCEVGKFLSSGGLHACRRDKLEGSYVFCLHDHILFLYSPKSYYGHASV